MPVRARCELHRCYSVRHKATPPPMPRLSATLLSAVALLGGGANAHASTVSASLLVATDLYGLRQVCAPPVVFADAARIAAESGERGALGAATLGAGCHTPIFIAADTFDRSDYNDRIDVCRVIAHEVGHALGREHDALSRSIMNPAWEPGSREVVAGCYRRFLPVGDGKDFRSWRGGPPLWVRA